MLRNHDQHNITQLLGYAWWDQVSREHNFFKYQDLLFTGSNQAIYCELFNKQL